MLSKDNLENGLQHAAASVTPNPTQNTQLPKASLLMFVLILLQELRGGVEGQGALEEGGGKLVVLEMYGSD